MKLKIQISEGYHITTWKKPIEIETDNYPQFKGLTESEIIDMINEESSDIPFEPGGDESAWSIYDELIEQDEEMSKEKNYCTQVNKFDE